MDARMSDSEWINNKCGEGTAGRGGAVFNCPSAWRFSQSLTAPGRQQTDIQTHFHQRCFLHFSSFFPSFCFFPLLHMWSTCSTLFWHLTSSFAAPIPARSWSPCCVLGRSTSKACFLSMYICATCVCALCCIYTLQLTAGVQRLVTTDLVLSQPFCQASLLLRNASPYLCFHSAKARIEQASNRDKYWFQILALIHTPVPKPNFN